MSLGRSDAQAGRFVRRPPEDPVRRRHEIRLRLERTPLACNAVVNIQPAGFQLRSSPRGSNMMSFSRHRVVGNGGRKGASRGRRRAGRRAVPRQSIAISPAGRPRRQEVTPRALRTWPSQRRRTISRISSPLRPGRCTSRTTTSGWCVSIATVVHSPRASPMGRIPSSLSPALEEHTLVGVVVDQEDRRRPRYLHRKSEPEICTMSENRSGPGQGWRAFEQ
jgi:hypothetical protein